jgi:hypothetical protein
MHLCGPFIVGTFEAEILVHRFKMWFCLGNNYNNQILLQLVSRRSTSTLGHLGLQSSCLVTQKLLEFLLDAVEYSSTLQAEKKTLMKLSQTAAHFDIIEASYHSNSSSWLSVKQT